MSSTSTVDIFPATLTRTVIPAQGNGRRFVRRKAAMLTALSQVIENGAQSGRYVQGVHVAALEQAITAQWGVPAAVATSSGTAALRLALEALDIKPGQEIILPALTFISTAYAVSDAGLIPVFVDSDPRTYTIDPAAVVAALSEKTVAIIAVHLYGQMADMAPLLEIADQHGLAVIEDAAQAHGATYYYHDGPRSAGSMGDLGCFSLNGVKNMGGLGDSGLITISERGLARHPAMVGNLRSLRDLGRSGRHRYVHDGWGWRARMDEFAARECLLELAELEAWNQRRRGIAARYDEALAATPFQSPIVAPGREHVYFAYPVLAPSTGQRQTLESALMEAGIEVVDAYTLVSEQRLYRTSERPCRILPLAVAQDIVGRITHLPLYPELEEEELERILAVLRQQHNTDHPM